MKHNYIVTSRVVSLDSSTSLSRLFQLTSSWNRGVVTGRNLTVHNSLYQMTAPCFCRSVLTCADDRFSVNIRSGPYYRTGHRKSVKIRKNSYGWQLCWFSCDHYRGVKTSWKTALSARRAFNTQLIPCRVSSQRSHSYQPSRNGRDSPGFLGLVPEVSRSRQNTNNVPE